MEKQWCRICGSRFSYNLEDKNFASAKIGDRDYFVCQTCRELIRECVK